MTILGLLSCIINTIIVVLMAIEIFTLEHPINLLWLLVVIPALVGQWFLTVRKRKQKKENDMHYVVINEWAVDGGEMANGIEIIAVCHSEEEAREAFDKRLPEEQDCARDSGWTVYEHDDAKLVFDAGKEGYYDAEHTKLYVERVQ